MARHHTLQLLIVLLIGIAIGHFYHAGLPGKNG